MAVFGEQNKGSEYSSFPADYIFGSKFSLSENGQATMITAWVKKASGYTTRMRFAIYEDVTFILKAYTEEKMFLFAYDNWTDAMIVWGGALTAGNYWLVGWRNNLGAEYYFTKGLRRYANVVYGDPPSPVALADESEGQYSIYCTYDAAVSPPVAAFSGVPLSGDKPLTVQFTDESTGTPTSWLWDFGDEGSSEEQDPEHIYENAGVYTVKLTATNDGGSDDEEKVDYITVSEPPVPPVAAFSAIPLSGEKPLTVQFTDESTEDPNSWSWDFGDDESSNDQSPKHTYQKVGTYTVTLTATNDTGSDDEIKVDYITVIAPPAADINPQAFSGYHCFIEQFQKRRQANLIPYKKPDGTLYRDAPSG